MGWAPEYIWCPLIGEYGGGNINQFTQLTSWELCQAKGFGHQIWVKGERQTLKKPGAWKAPQ